MKTLADDGFTTVIVTHEMDFARAISAEGVFLDKRVIVERAASEKFITNPEGERGKQFLQRHC